MSEPTVLRVAYTASDPYAKYLGVSLCSLLQANTSFSRVECFVPDSGIRPENKQKLLEVAAPYGCALTFLPMPDIAARLGLQGTAAKGAAMYARLLLPAVLPDAVDKILYLDCDTVVADDLAALWNTPLPNAYLAGVQDTIDAVFHKAIGLAPEVPYLNAGVQLINLKRWREENMEERFKAFIRKFQGQVPFHDQGLINGVCGADRVLLPVRYNLTSNLYSYSAQTIRRIYFLDRFYSQQELDEAKAAPAILHFTSGLVGRPWEEGCTHPEKERYLRAKQCTPWAQEPLAPRTLAPGTRAFAFFFRHAPRPLFETAYRALGGLRRLKR